jgi:hypothetical protein
MLKNFGINFSEKHFGSLSLLAFAAVCVFVEW